MLNVRDDFPMLRREVDGKPLIYLDSAATSLKPQAVIDAVTRYYTHCTSNVHRAMHAIGEEATEAYEGAREAMSRFIHCDDDEVIFTRGSTEGINLVRRCLPRVKRTLSTVMEHHSNLLPMGPTPDGDANGGVLPTVVTVDREGNIDLAALEAELSKGVDLLSVTHVSNVLGSISPVKRIVELAHAKGALVLLDAAQSVPHIPVDVRELGVDFLVCSGHKMLGPSGVGVLYGKIDLLEEMTPWHLGGNVVDHVHLDGYTMQELPHRLEAGTPAIEAVIGFGAAIEYLEDLEMEAVREHDKQLVAHALKRLGEIDKLNLVGPLDGEHRVGSVTFNVTGLEAHGVARMLSHRGNILVRSGFHCAQPLHEALDLLPTVRASFQVYNTLEEVDALADALQSIAGFVRA